jgi:hypothetical protein
MPATRPPVNVGSGDHADHVVATDGHGRRLVRVARIAQRALYKEVQDRDGNVKQQQRRYCFVDAPVVAQRTDNPDPDPAADERGQRHDAKQHGRRRPGHHRNGDDRRAETAKNQRPFATDNNQAEPGRYGNAKRGEDQRRGTNQRVLPGKTRSKAAAPDKREEVRWRFAESQQKDRKQDAGDDQRQDRHDHVFR